jgi:Na+-driven multidrug efflux pump
VCYYLGNRYATGYGETYSAAHNVAMQIWLFSAFFIDGYAAAGSVIVGRLNGAGDRAGLYRTGWQVVGRSVAIGTALALLYLAGYGLIGGLFSDDPQVLTLLHGVFWLVVITQPINAVAFAFDGIFKGLGEGVVLRNVLLVSTFVVFVPVAWATDGLGWELHAVWTAFLLWMIARGGSLAVLFKRRHGPPFKT